MGFKRTYSIMGKEVENYDSNSLSGYSPTHYNFYKDNKYCFWGLVERNKPPVMFLGRKKIMVVGGGLKTLEDGYRSIFSIWGEHKYPLIFEVFCSEGLLFNVDYSYDKTPDISIKKNYNKNENN